MIKIIGIDGKYSVIKRRDQRIKLTLLQNSLIISLALRVPIILSRAIRSYLV